MTTFSQIGCIRTYTGETVVIVRPKFELPIFWPRSGALQPRGGWSLSTLERSRTTRSRPTAQSGAPKPTVKLRRLQRRGRDRVARVCRPKALGPFVAAVSILPMFMFFLNIAFDLRNRGRFEDYQNKYFARVGIFAFFVLLVMAG